MKQIWRFPLKVQDKQSILMPIGAIILSVQSQIDTPCLWAVVDPEEGTENRHIEFVGTGNRFNDDGLKFIDTIQLHGGRLIFHIFEDTSY